MIAVVSGRLIRFFMPGGVLLLVGILFANSVEVIHWRPIVAKGLLFVVPVAGLLVCWRFNKFKPFFAISVLFLAEWALKSFCRGADVDPQLARVVRNTVAVLLPLNFAWLSLGKERGVINFSGMAKLLFVVAQPLLIAVLFSRQPVILSYFGKEIFSWDFFGWTTLAHSAIAAYLLALVVLAINLFKQRGAIDTGFIWALVASYFGLAVYTGLLSTTCLMLGGLILLISVVETAYAMAFRDDLTGLPARRALNELLLRLRGDYTIAMLDIDFFKKFNDSYGHDVGDQVLKMVAAQVARVKGGGRPFRYGGEEFTVVFPGKAGGDVVDCLEKVRKSVESAGFVLRKEGRSKNINKGRKGRHSLKKAGHKKVGVTISIGVASRDERASNPDQVVKKADIALYKAKKAGRNRLVF